MNSEPALKPQPLVNVRIDELKQLEHGWLNGQGFAPPHAGLDWFGEAFNCYFPEDLPRPYLYPTPEGGVRVEWSAKPHELSLDIDLKARTGFWHVLNLADDTEHSRVVNLNDKQDWGWLGAEVRKLVGVDA